MYLLWNKEDQTSMQCMCLLFADSIPNTKQPIRPINIYVYNLNAADVPDDDVVPVQECHF